MTKENDEMLTYKPQVKKIQRTKKSTTYFEFRLTRKFCKIMKQIQQRQDSFYFIICVPKCPSFR